MKFSFRLQTLILTALGAAMAVVTACWAVHVYALVYAAILNGFDRKLLTLSGGAAAFMDGDAHAAFERPRTISAAAPQSPTALLGADAATGALVTINPANGGAQLLSTGVRVRSLARIGDGRLFGLRADGAALVEFADGISVRRTLNLPELLDGIAAMPSGLEGWRGTAMFAVNPASAELSPRPESLPAPLRSLVADPITGIWYGLSSDSATLWSFHRGGAPPNSVRLFSEAPPATDGGKPERTLPPALQSLVLHEGKLYGAGTTLASIDPESGLVLPGSAQPGFFSVDASFYRHYRPAYIKIQRDAGLTYLYTQVYLGGKKIYYIMDGTTSDSYSPPGSPDVLPDQSVAGAETVQYLNRPWFSSIQHWAIWGLLKSCFTPITDSEGHVVAMAGADVDITTIRRRTHWALFEVVFVGVATLIAGGFISYGVARTLTRPLRQIKNSALHIASGGYGARVDVRGTREIEELGRELDTLSRDLAGLDLRARDSEGKIALARQRVLLEHALETFGAHTPGREGSALLAPGSPGRNVVWMGASAFLWLTEGEPDPLVAAGRDARLAALFGALLRAQPPVHVLLETAQLAEPALAAMAVWEPGSRQLHVRARRAFALTIIPVVGQPATTSIAATAEILVAAGERIIWPARAGAAGPVATS